MTKLGKYELIERLAIGGMAELFKAQMLGDRGFKKTVAIKKILPQLAANATFLDMFADEARITAMLDHPNIVQVFEFDTEDDEPYLVMQLIDGNDLFHLMGQLRKLDTPMPVEMAVFIAREILDALDYAHNAADDDGQPLGIVHRDVSPGNVLLSRRGNVLLTDFGIAWAYRRHQKTEAGKLKGKFGYMSPEQVTGDPLDARSDVFACGILLSELLINRHLFVGQSDLDILLMVRDADLSRLIEYGSHIPADLMDIIVKSLAPKLPRRYQSAHAFRDALSEWLFDNRKRVSCPALADYVADIRRRIIDHALELAHGVSGKKADEPPKKNLAAGSDSEWSDETVPHRGPGSDRSDSVAATRVRAQSASPVAEPKNSLGRPPANPSTQRPRVGQGGAAPGRKRARSPKNGGPKLDVFTKPTRKQAVIGSPHAGLGRARSSPPAGSLSKRPISVVSEPDEVGDFSVIAPMSLFYRLVTDESSGLLIVKRNNATKEAYFHSGHPRFVGSNITEERLGDFLVRRGAIDREELNEAVMMLPHFDNHLLDALISLGFIEPLDAFRYLNAQVSAKVLEVCYWTEGNYAWYQGRRAPRQSRKLQLDMYVIMGHAAKNLEVAQVVAWAKSVRNQQVVANVGGIDLERFGMGEAMERARVLLENHRASVTELAGRVRDPAARLEFIRALYLLIECGLAGLAEADAG